jgi:hypothetical protein
MQGLFIVNIFPLASSTIFRTTVATRNSPPQKRCISRSNHSPRFFDPEFNVCSISDFVFTRTISPGSRSSTSFGLVLRSVGSRYGATAPPLFLCAPLNNASATAVIRGLSRTLPEHKSRRFVLGHSSSVVSLPPATQSFDKRSAPHHRASSFGCICPAMTRWPLPV